MMKPEYLKARSRGISTDMSPQAIARRFGILVELDNAARALSSARLLRKRPKGNADDNDIKDNRGEKNIKWR